MDHVTFLEMPQRRDLRRPGSAVAAIVTALWTLGLAALISDPARFVGLYSLLSLATLVMIVVRLFRIGRSSPMLRLSVWWMVACILAIYVTTITEFLGFYVAGVPVVCAGIWLALVSPATSVVLTLLFCGFSGSIKEYTPFPVGVFLDVFLIGLWVAAALRFGLGHRKRRVLMLPATWLTGALVLISFLQLVASPSSQQPLFSFRSVTWYIMALLIVAYTEWTPEARLRMQKGFVLVCLAVGGYATLRLGIGPSAKEQAYAAAAGGYGKIDGTSRLIGSLETGENLGIFCCATIPLLFALVTALPGRWRVFSLAGAMLMTIALFGTSVRNDVLGVIAGMAVVMLGVALMRALPPWRVAVAIAISVAAVGLGIGGFLYTTNNSPEKRDRYARILKPKTDESIQLRRFKWSNAIREIETKPLGHGFGSGGDVFQRSGRYQSIETKNIDNSYLFMAFQQGWGVMCLFIVMLLLIFVTLFIRGVSSSRRPAGATAIGAAGGLLAFSVSMMGGEVVQTTTALVVWIVVGMGLSWFTSPADPDDDPEEPAVPESPPREVLPPRQLAAAGHSI
jgi:hypothetical protein